ncbi:MAG: ribosome silencing factor [Porphyromonas sp.]|nr:ribosome silencing factor [Porphyromonas sp.]
MKHENNSKTRELVDSVVEGIQEKKGRAISVLDMRELDDAICDYMVIAEANTPIQLEAMEESVAETTKERLDEKPQYRHKGDGRWIALDYITVMIHLMTPEMRDYYKIEQLWSDADIEHLQDIN